MKEKKKRAKRLPTFAESITPIIAMLLILTIGKGVFGYSTEPLLIMVAAIAAFIAFRVGVTWDEMMDEICTKIAKGMPAILILVCVGAMVGTWMAAGTIPMMIYYGVQIVNPKFMLVTAFLIEAVVSVVTGTSWGSVATMGVALMGIASALGVSLPATAGACIAGSYFGDKMSPLSDIFVDSALSSIKASAFFSYQWWWRQIYEMKCSLLNTCSQSVCYLMSDSSSPAVEIRIA